MPNFDEYFPFDLGFGATANAARWRKMAQLWAPDGVIQGHVLGELLATIAGSSVTLNPGAVFIHGYYAELRTAQSISVGTSGTIVAKVDLNNEVCSVYYKDTAVDYGINVTSNYEQSANNWEIPLWLVNTGVLTSLRNLIGPGRVTAWWGSYNTPFTITTGNSTPQPIMVIRPPYTAPAIFRGTAQITFTDATVAQSAQFQLTYQSGQTDAATSSVVTIARNGGGSAGSAVVPVFLTGTWTVGQGRKTIGAILTCGSGTSSIQVTGLTASIELMNAAPTA